MLAIIIITLIINISYLQLCWIITKFKGHERKQMYRQCFALGNDFFNIYIQGIENTIPIQPRAKGNFHRRTDVDRTKPFTPRSASVFPFLTDRFTIFLTLSFFHFTPLCEFLIFYYIFYCGV